MTPLVEDLGKLLINKVQDAYVGLARAARIIDFPVPPNSSMRKTSSKTIRHYYLSGLCCYLPIAAIALQRNVPLYSAINVLDFGCGVGRELLHFTRHFPTARYFACDVDYTLVEFIRNNYPAVQVQVNTFHPPLKYGADSMEMIYSVSTFSHLHPEDHGPWLEELYRITKPNGWCFLTTEGRVAFSALRKVLGQDEDVERVLDKRGILYQEYAHLKRDWDRRHLSPLVNRTYGIEGSYGNTVVTAEYVRRTWPTSGFEVVDVIEGIIDHRQDLVVLHKATPESRQVLVS